MIPRLNDAVDGDLPCTGTTMITLWGNHFTPGTEAIQHMAWPEDRVVGTSAWVSGKTMVELGGTGGIYPPREVPSSRPRLVIVDQGTMQLTFDKCILLTPGLKVRIWFLDGTKSAWQRVRTDWAR